MNRWLSRIALAARVLRYGRIPEQPGPALRAITPEEVAEAKDFFPMPKFFIIGHARSGTTLLARLMRLHPEIHTDWQAHFFTRPPLLRGLVGDAQVREWLSRRSNRWNRGEDMSPLLLRAAADFVMEREARRLGKTIVGDKSPNSLLDGRAVREMHSVYPDAKLIFIVRDGRDVVLSHRFQNFIDALQLLSREDLSIRAAFEKDPAPFFQGERSLFSKGGLASAAAGWARNLAETDQVGRELYPGRYISLRFEDLLAAPYQELSAIWRFLDADPSGLEKAVASEMSSNPDADWQREKAGELVSNLEKGKRGSWRELFTSTDTQAFKLAAGQTLVEWKYEKGMDW
jgi:hypothetical protein